MQVLPPRVTKGTQTSAVRTEDLCEQTRGSLTASRQHASIQQTFTESTTRRLPGRMPRHRARWGTQTEADHQAGGGGAGRKPATSCYDPGDSTTFQAGSADHQAPK